MGIIYNDYWLAHHGIQGQKWGVQNGPPYPLDKKTSSRVTRKAQNNTEKPAKKIHLNSRTFDQLQQDSQRSWNKHADLIIDKAIDDLLDSDAWQEALARDRKEGGYPQWDLYDEVFEKACDEVRKSVKKDMIIKYGEEFVKKAIEANNAYKFYNYRVDLHLPKS